MIDEFQLASSLYRIDYRICRGRVKFKVEDIMRRIVLGVLKCIKAVQ